MFSSQRQRNRFLLVFSACMLAGLFLPWFSLYADGGGFCMGVVALPYVFSQILTILLLCGCGGSRPLFFWITEGLLVSIPFSYLWVLMSWHALLFSLEISLQSGLSSALPGFWIALVLSALPPICFPWFFHQGQNHNRHHLADPC